MSEIPPLSPAYPVTKPVRIKRDDNSQKKQFQEKKQSANERDEPETEPLTHIDEIV